MPRTFAAKHRLVVAATVLALGVVAVVTSTPSGAAGDTAFGAVVKPQPGESFSAALRRSESAYGHLGVIRYFDGNAPDSWPALTAKLKTHDAIVSWRIPPKDVLSGRYDTLIRDWFASAPTDRMTWYSYMHEPEDNIARGEFTAADYRAAFQHVTQLARSAANPKLRSTLILMCFTANPASGRNWRDYFAGSANVDVMGWDCYNHGNGAGGYGTPANLFANAIADSRSVGLPWGIAELGSTLAGGDRGQGRAAWLTACARYLSSRGAAFVSYFDTNGAGTDYRLLDKPSRGAWHDVVVDQVP
ncbi:MAG: hypothetical protein DLM59_06125 [Pseudonocardiales bacterium]|nr:MAG: hypothetical protein DLM59_06125 [Pseudonocardiales bacterium]